MVSKSEKGRLITEQQSKKKKAKKEEVKKEPVKSKLAE